MNGYWTQPSNGFRQVYWWCIAPNGIQNIILMQSHKRELAAHKPRIWVHRKIVMAQEKALHRFHSGWSNFTDWVNDTTNDINVKFSYRQSQKLFIQHFSRRLLVAHGKQSTFTCEVHPTSKSMATAVRELIGENGGVIPSAMEHGCTDCTHVKRYRLDLEQEGVTLNGSDADVAESESGPAQSIDQTAVPLPPNLAEILPQQEPPTEGSSRGYVHMAVMDGKTLKHQKCALEDCNNPL
ncbi:hypothetical protein B0H13DRAFT_1931734 [Mycena leptocephala]|nr:hypothetical protein B0H13DRAFT_1931734 [Mycena leptocephala]